MLSRRCWKISCMIFYYTLYNWVCLWEVCVCSKYIYIIYFFGELTCTKLFNYIYWMLGSWYCLEKCLCAVKYIMDFIINCMYQILIFFLTNLLLYAIWILIGKLFKSISLSLTLLSKCKKIKQINLKQNRYLSLEMLVNFWTSLHFATSIILQFHKCLQ